MNKIILIGIFIGSLAAFGCEPRHKGPLEKAGERTDEIIDNVKEGQAPLHRKGTLEKAGESVDDALGNDRNRRR